MLKTNYVIRLALIFTYLLLQSQVRDEQIRIKVHKFNERLKGLCRFFATQLEYVKLKGRLYSYLWLNIQRLTNLLLFGLYILFFPFNKSLIPCKTTLRIGIDSCIIQVSNHDDQLIIFVLLFFRFCMISATITLRTLFLISLTMLTVKSRFFDTFPELIETGSYNYDISNSRAGVTISFKNPKNVTNYGQVLSFQKLQMQMDSNNCYSIYLKTTNKFMHGLTFDIDMSCSNTLQAVSVRYLLVSSGLSNDISLNQAQLNRFSNPLSIPQHSSHIFYTDSKSSSLNRGALVLQGFQTQGSSSFIRFDLDLDINSNDFNIRIRRQSAYFRISFICVTAILMDNRIRVRNTSATIYRSSKQQGYNNPNDFSYANSSAKFLDDSLFYGLKSFVSAYSQQLNFHLQRVSNSELKLYALDNPSSTGRLMIQFINFVFLICDDSSNQYFFPSNYSCLSSCPDSFFCNESQPLYCEPCSSACLTCQTTSNTCTSCVNTSYVNSSACVPCVSPCITCTALATCSSCMQPLYRVSSNSCVPNCSLVSECTTTGCSVVGGNINCTSCNTGYNAVSGVCRAICGDGYKIGPETCDDGNTADGDGCSAICRVEQFWTCQPSGGATSTSTCTLTSVGIAPAYTVKSKKDSAFTSVYTVRPNLPFMSQMNWVQGISFTSGSITIVSIMFDQGKGTLIMECTYAEDLSDATLQIVYSSLGTQLSTIPTLQLAHKIQTDNNLSLNVYSSTIYTLSTIMEYVCFGLSTVTLLIFLLGFLGGKLIALQHVAVFQLTYLCTIAVQNASPTSAALRKLQLSTGSLQLGDYDYQSTIDRQFKGVNMGGVLFSSFNIGYLIALIIFIVAVLLKLTSVTCCKKSDKIRAVWPTVLGELTFYSIMFSAYAAFSEICSGVLVLVNGSSQMAASLVVSSVIGIMAILYAYFLKKKADSFGVFKKRFRKCDISQYFYTFMTLQRLVSPLIIISLRKLPMGLAAELGIVGAIIVFVALRTPYIQGDSKRALINLCMAAANILLMMVDNLLGKSPSVIIPMVVASLLTASTGVNSYYLISQFKEIYYLKAESKQSSTFGVLFSNIVRYDKPENVQEKNEFQLQFLKNRIIVDSPSLNPILNSTKNYATMREKMINEQWEFYATLSKAKILNRLQGKKIEEYQADGTELKSLKYNEIEEQ